jgi:hypothetical protein
LSKKDKILSKKDKIDLKNANVGIAVSALVLVLGFVPFHDSGGATEALTGRSVHRWFRDYVLLDWRDEKKRDKDSRRSA